MHLYDLISFMQVPSFQSTLKYLVMMFPICVLSFFTPTQAIEVARFHHSVVNAVQVNAEQVHLLACSKSKNESFDFKNKSGLHGKNDSSVHARNHSRSMQSPPEDLEAEDFKTTPCGEEIYPDDPGSAAGDGDTTPPQQKVIEGVKKVCGELTKDTPDSEKACAKLDEDKKDGISKAEFDKWIKAQPFEPQMKDDDMRDAMFKAFSNGKDTLDISRCRAVVKEHGTVLNMKLRKRH